ncbi:MAG TPA: Gp37 family protein [Vampirovibrionales bacterium]
MLIELERAIADRIRAGLAGKTQVVEFPDEPDGLGRPVIRSRVIFGYQRASFRWTAERTQEKTFFFEAVFQAKNLRAHQDPCYELLDAVSLSLTGWRPFALASRDLEQTDERFVSFADGVWIYSQTYSLTITISEGVRQILSPLADPLVAPDEQERRRQEFFRQYMTPNQGVVLPPYMEVVCGLWRSRIDKVAVQNESSLDATFTTGGDLAIDIDTQGPRVPPTTFRPL